MSEFTLPATPTPNQAQANELLGTSILYQISVVDNDGCLHDFVLSMDATIDLVNDLLDNGHLVDYIAIRDVDDTR